MNRVSTIKACKRFTHLSILKFCSLLLLTQACRDYDGEFRLKDGNDSSSNCVDARKNQDLCKIPVVRKNCNYTCFKCCEDRKEEFRQVYPDLNWATSKSCSMVKNHPEVCAKSKKWRDHCPRSCNVCPCFDNPGQFRRKVNGKGLSCQIAALHPKKCGTRLFSENCPRTCNLCSVPEPYEPKCEIDAKLSFPPLDEIEYYGYSSDYVTVIKNGIDTEDEACGYQRTRTSWGCSHNGTARVFKLNEDRYYSLRESESVHITDAQSSSFDFIIKHYFSDNELYYKGDENIIGTLSIKTTKSNLKSFRSRPNNKGQDTHNEDGSINPLFKGSALVRVTCDHKCNCEMSKIQEDFL